MSRIGTTNSFLANNGAFTESRILMDYFQVPRNVASVAAHTVAIGTWEHFEQLTMAQKTLVMGKSRSVVIARDNTIIVFGETSPTELYEHFRTNNYDYVSRSGHLMFYKYSKDAYISVANAQGLDGMIRALNRAVIDETTELGPFVAPPAPVVAAGAEAGAAQPPPAAPPVQDQPVSLAAAGRQNASSS